MPPSSHIASAIQKISEAIADLQQVYPERKFTMDGRLVGDFGEILAKLMYDIELDNVQRAQHDAVHRSDPPREVQIKATFASMIAFRNIPHYCIALKIYADGSCEEIYNGPGRLIEQKLRHRTGFGNRQLGLSLSALRELSQAVAPEDRIPRRPEVGAAQVGLS